MRLILFSFVFLFAITSFAQKQDNSGYSYVPFPDSGASWRYTVLWYPNPFGFNWYHENIVMGEEIIDSIMYQKVYLIKRDVYCHDIILDGPDYMGAFYNDTLNKKVYYKPGSSDSTYLLYDFSVDVGDFLSDMYLSWMGDDGVYVESIDTVLLEDGSYRRKFTLSDTSNYPNEWPWLIEGIGSQMEPFGGIYYYFESWSTLLCFIDETPMKFAAEDYDCCPFTDTCTVSIEDRQLNEDVLLLPNPVARGASFTLKLDGINKNLIDIKVYTCNGELVNHYQTCDNYFTIRAPVTSGLYMVKIEMDGAVIALKKMIVN